QYVEDAIGRVATVLELGTSNSPFSLETDYTYDGFNNIKTVNQKGGAGDTFRTLRSFSYDGLSRLITSTNGETGTICFGVWSGTNCINGYDGDGNLLSKTDASGLITSFYYDGANRLVAKQFSAHQPSSCYQFDSVN